MRLAIVSDEIDVDPAVSIPLAAEWGIHLLELRSLPEGRVPRVSPQTVASLKALAAANGSEFLSLSPGIAKTVPGPVLEEHRRALVEESIRMAEDFGLARVICFGIQRAGEAEGDAAAFARTVDCLGEIGSRLCAAGMLPLLENEPGFWPDTFQNTKMLLDALSGSGWKLNFDPGNFYSAGERDFVAGYRLLKPYIAHVHMKDADAPHHFVPLGEGEMHWEALLNTMAAEGYAGPVVIETHCRPGREMSERCARWVQAILRKQEKEDTNAG